MFNEVVTDGIYIVHLLNPNLTPGQIANLSSGFHVVEAEVDGEKHKAVLCAQYEVAESLKPRKAEIISIQKVTIQPKGDNNA